MGLFSFLFGGEDGDSRERHDISDNCIGSISNKVPVGLSNGNTNMKNPIGRFACERFYDECANWGGFGVPLQSKVGVPVDPGMEMYEVYRNDAPHHEPDCVATVLLCRGVMFAVRYVDGENVVMPRVIEYQRMDDGGKPSFRGGPWMSLVEGDLYRASRPFLTWIDGNEVAVTAEVNWNKDSGEFVYRESYEFNPQEHVPFIDDYRGI